jgi:hypothetical protein
MTHDLKHSVSRLLLAAGLFAGAVAVQAASNASVKPGQEALVADGMDTSSVQHALGSPAVKHRFVSEPGATWTYRVAGKEQTVFDVDFGTDGRVASAEERMAMTGRAGGDR